mgnify:FL=1
MIDFISFNKPFITPLDEEFLNNLRKNFFSLSGDGFYTKKVHKWLEEYSKSKKALLTHSCTAALEMSAILLNIKKGDEVIMPSYTFVSTANSVVLRGGVPRFVDIREDTLNIDEEVIEEAINKSTKAIIPVHYAGVGCEMDKIIEIARRNNLHVVEDSAQGVMAYYKGKPLGSIGDLGAFSFHDTKNIISGEGGALIINNSEFKDRAEIIREKGTNRSLFLKGEVDKYTWCDMGSSYLPSDLIAGFLLNQLKISKEITKKRLEIWQNYHFLLENLEKDGLIKRPLVPKECNHNGHIYYFLVNFEKRELIMKKLLEKNIQTATHYVPLHSSKAGLRYCKVSGSLLRTNNIANSIIRLPIWIGLSIQQQEYIVESIEKVFKSNF